MGKKRRKRDSSSSDSEDLPPPISADDYYLKGAEFRVWLLSKKQQYIEDLPTEKAKEVFRRKFVKRWNAGRLSRRYYEGIAPEEVQAAGRTKHAWRLQLTADEAKSLELSRAAIVHDTNQQSFVDTRRAEGARFSAPVEWPAATRPPSTATAAAAAPAAAASSSRAISSEADERLQAEIEREIDSAVVKYERRKFKEKQRLVEEELVPKKEGRERRIEKRQMKGPSGPNSGGGDSLMGELTDRDAYGAGGDDFQRRLAAERQRNEKRLQARQELAQAALKEYQQKEEAKLAPFRAMLAAGAVPLLANKFAAAGNRT